MPAQHASSTGRLIDITGVPYYRLTPIRWVRIPGRKGIFWECRCECGNFVTVLGGQIRRGHTKSCGCLRNDQLSTHGASKTREYKCWKSIKARCYNPSNRAYRAYGGKGVKMCAEWKFSFENFQQDMGPCPSPYHTIDRFPNKKGNYEPGNCRWATMKEQCRNKSNTTYVFFRGSEIPLVTLAEQVGMDSSTLKARLKTGMSVDEAIAIKPGCLTGDTQRVTGSCRGGHKDASLSDSAPVPLKTLNRPGRKRRNRIGEQFGLLTVIAYAETYGKGSQSIWLCQCKCGRLKKIRNCNLQAGTTISCGCHAAKNARERLSTHKKSKTPEWRSWMAMRTRCLNKNCKCFPHYGGRGITICDSWLHRTEGFQAFLKDMGPRPSLAHTLDRIDVNGHYTKENCRWATLKQQSRNKQVMKLILYNGRSLCAPEWAEVTGIPAGTIRSRIVAHWTIEETLTTPSGPPAD